MKMILAAMLAVMIGLAFAGSTFADEKKTDAPAGAPAGEVKKDEGTKKDDGKEHKGKKHKDAADKDKDKDKDKH